MVVTVRVLLTLSAIAHLVGVAAIRHADQVHRSSTLNDRMFGSSGYGTLVHVDLLALAALAALVLVGLTAVIVTGIHLWEVGGTWRWTYLAGILLCLVAQFFAFVTRHPDVCLVLVGLHTVAGLALSASLGPRRSGRRRSARQSAARTG